MRHSARHTRSMFIRYAISETFAFPGIRTDWPAFPYNVKRSRNTAGRNERLVYSV